MRCLKRSGNAAAAEIFAGMAGGRGIVPAEGLAVIGGVFGADMVIAPCLPE